MSTASLAQSTGAVTAYLLLLLGKALAPLPLLPRVMLLTSLVVITMTWLVAPQLTRLLKPWLYPARPASPSA